MTITLTREEAQQVLDALNTVYGAPRYEASKILRSKLSEPNIVQDAIVYGTGITKDGKRIDPASIYKEPEPEPVAWNEVMQHYCYLLDNLGDLPIPDFINWAHKQWEKGSVLLDANDYFRTAPPQRDEPEPVAWRTFDGEGGYEYRSYEMNENYGAEWLKRNPNHKGWVELLYADPTPCQTCEALARTVMMDQTSHDTAPPQREWQGLTDKEILADEVLRYHFGLNGGAGPVSKKGKAVIEAVTSKLREKNT
jgi:hypothetical protein